MSETTLALSARSLSHRYGQHLALDDLNLDVSPGQIFALLGPNGSGKTTLFRLISTQARKQSGELIVFGYSVSSEPTQVRSSLGMVFQAPSLDAKLTVLENLKCQAALYGVSGGVWADRIRQLTTAFGIADRLDSKAEQLSGGLKRRVELAKSLLHQPRLLLMDEPSTGLDPAARLDLWSALTELRQNFGVTILLTTHLLEEAEKADRVAIMDQGRIVAEGDPMQLRASLGDQLLQIRTPEASSVMQWLVDRGVESTLVAGQVRVAGSAAAQTIAPLLEHFGDNIKNVNLGQPSLEDVFVARTGHRFADDNADS